MMVYNPHVVVNILARNNAFSPHIHKNNEFAYVWDAVIVLAI